LDPDPPEQEAGLLTNQLQCLILGISLAFIVYRSYVLYSAVCLYSVHAPSAVSNSYLYKANAKVHVMKPYRKSRDTAPLFLTSALDSLVNFKPQPLYSRKEARYPFNRRLGGPQSQSGFLGKALMSLPASNPIVSRP
jgi:hypothetical protein